MKLTSKPLGILILVIMFGSILFTTAMNWWRTESTKVPVKFSEGEVAGEYNPADIRGSYKMSDIEKSFRIPVADLKTAFAIPDDVDAASYQVKNLEEKYAPLAAEGKEVGTTSVRYFVALYRSLPFTVSGDIWMPDTAVAVLKQKAKLTSDQIAYLDSHTVRLNSSPAVTPAVPVSTPQPKTTPSANETHTAPDRTMSGKTTFKEILDWGVPKDTIQEIIGGEIPSTAMTVRDYCTQKSLDFNTIKTALQAEVDKTK
ncbi:MAG TPA: hypothetical protein VIO61_17220 [Anaerolineaceae bacterium]